MKNSPHTNYLLKVLQFFSPSIAPGIQLALKSMKTYRSCETEQISKIGAIEPIGSFDLTKARRGGLYLLQTWFEGRLENLRETCFSL